MNFLGHAYIARNHPHLIAGNFGGDSYKGNLAKFEHLPKHILDGIKLHRFIDNFTDNSEHIIKAGKLLQSKGVQKIAYIATDILVDYYLAGNWNQFSDENYDDFLEYVYQQTDKGIEHLDEEFNLLFYRVKRYGWMKDYESEQGMRKIFRQFSKRIGFENDLQKCFELYLNESKTFDEHFNNFLVEIDTASIEFISTL